MKPIGSSWSWIAQNVMRIKDTIDEHPQIWDQEMQRKKFSLKLMYEALMQDDTLVPWRFRICRNRARPKAIITIWLVFHGRVATKDRFVCFGMLQDNICGLCKEQEESIHHLFFACSETKPIWQAVLNWLEIMHDPKGWLEEKPWLLQYSESKGWKAEMMKLAVTKTLQEIWLYRNDIIFLE